jgi:hypothetical protein
MKNIKKLVSVICIITLLFSITCINASAAKIGDVINYALPTDIVASINGYQLMSFNVDGLTYIVAEDLRHYGINVTYDNASRSLSLERNATVSSIAPHITNAKFWEIGTNKARKNILFTDIVTNINGNPVNSYNIDGATIICFNDLSQFGQVIYDDDKREISLEIEGIEHNIVSYLAEYMVEQTGQMYEESVNTAAKEAYGDHVICETFIRAKGDIIVFENYLRGVTLNAAQKKIEQSSIEQDRDEIKSTYQEVKEIFPELNGVAMTIYDDSNTQVAGITIYLD